MLAHVFQRIEDFFQDKCIFQLYHFLPGVKITFWTAVVPAVARVTPEVILAPRLTSILARGVVPGSGRQNSKLLQNGQMSFPPCQRFAFEGTILRSSILDSLCMWCSWWWNNIHLRRTIVPGGVVRFVTLRSFCRPAGGLLAPPFRQQDSRLSYLADLTEICLC